MCPVAELIAHRNKERRLNLKLAASESEKYDDDNLDLEIKNIPGFKKIFWTQYNLH